MAVFSMDSDKYFIRQNSNCTGVLIYEYYEYPTSSFTYSRVGFSARMTLFGNVSEVEFDHSWSGLEVFGVTFSGESLAALVRDMTIAGSDGKKEFFLVNRQDLCFKEVGREKKNYERIYGHFSWSKYGVVKVKPCLETGNGAVSVRPLAFMPPEDDDDFDFEP